MHIATGIAQCISIIGIPVGIANFKIAAIALWPVGRRVVSVETAQAARAKPMHVVVSNNPLIWPLC